MKRKHDWRSSLYRRLAEVERTPFAWGSNDCAHFAASCIEAMTGENPLDSLSLPEYETASGAMNALAAIGFGDLPSAVAGIFDEVPPSLAQIGDIAICETAETGCALAIVLGETLGAVGSKGYYAGPREAMIRAFRVP